MLSPCQRLTTCFDGYSLNANGSSHCSRREFKPRYTCSLEDVLFINTEIPCISIQKLSDIGWYTCQNRIDRTMQQPLSILSRYNDSSVLQIIYHCSKKEWVSSSGLMERLR